MSDTENQVEPDVMTQKLTGVHVGFIPLIDSAPLVIARELGMDVHEGVSLHLHREVSWANIRDKVNVGWLDCAHMLAPMPLAATLGLGHVRERVIAPVTLSLNGNGITVSREIFAQMQDISPDDAHRGGHRAAQALAQVVEERAARGAQPLTFGTVYPFSCHAYELRFWLAEAGIDPDRDLRLVVLPPSLMTDSLRAGHIDGFCAGEPWNTYAVNDGCGRIVATKRELWKLAPEKVLGVRLDWADENPQALHGLVRAIVNAARWLDRPENRIQAAEILARERYLDLPVSEIAPALTSTLVREEGLIPGQRDKGFILFGGEDGNRPSQLHALWLLTQMARWGELDGVADLRAVAREVYREDLYIAALGEPQSETSAVDQEVCEAASFDPRKLESYLRSFDITAIGAGLDDLADAQPHLN